MSSSGSFSSSEEKLRNLELQLKKLDAERSKIFNSIEELRLTIHAAPEFAPVIEPVLLGKPILNSPPITPDEKTAVFLKLFRCRESVFPKRWENAKSGKSGYAPTCRNEWVQPICQKPRIKCTDCRHQAFPPLDEKAVQAHLKGQLTIGTYAINEDDSCLFLVCDFDGSGWQEDVSAYRDIGISLGVDVAVERSRSGQGAHAWIFFDGRVPARVARNLGTLILSRCIEIRHQLSLDSYDRFFPSQDYLPKGGFGNLIALPLQKAPREFGNSCFLDEKLSVILGQWEYLAQIKRPNCREVQSLLERFLPRRCPRSGSPVKIPPLEFTSTCLKIVKSKNNSSTEELIYEIQTYSFPHFGSPSGVGRRVLVRLRKNHPLVDRHDLGGFYFLIATFNLTKKEKLNEKAPTFLFNPRGPSPRRQFRSCHLARKCGDLSTTYALRYLHH